jgi:hypothetical protein
MAFETAPRRIPARGAIATGGAQNPGGGQVTHFMAPEPAGRADGTADPNAATPEEMELIDRAIAHRLGSAVSAAPREPGAFEMAAAPKQKGQRGARDAFDPMRCHDCGLQGHRKKDCRWGATGPAVSEQARGRPGVCTLCGNVGHRAKDCRMPGFKRDRRPGDRRDDRRDQGRGDKRGRGRGARGGDAATGYGGCG